MRLTAVVPETFGTFRRTEALGAPMKKIAIPLFSVAALLLLLLSASAAPPQPAPLAPAHLEKAAFAGGCFWCMVGPFDKLPGVAKVLSGYTGGRTKNPTYEEVSSGSTGHAESVEVTYDPTKISYQRLLDVYWHNVDPLNPNGQFCDYGNQYRTAIFYHDATQKRLAEESKAAIERSHHFKEPVVTQIVAATEFYPAEEYHQDYYKKNPVRYKFYRYNCGRDKRLAALWGKSEH
jgi:peptide-methionine (S)-S-oxide reductase